MFYPINWQLRPTTRRPSRIVDHLSAPSTSETDEKNWEQCQSYKGNGQRRPSRIPRLSRYFIARYANAQCRGYGYAFSEFTSATILDCPSDLF